MAESLYTLQEIRDYTSKHKSIVTTPEEIFEFWEKREWKTKKGTYIQSLFSAINVANGTINYVKNKDFYTKRNRERRKELKTVISAKIEEQKKKKSKPKPYEKYTDQLSRPEWQAFRQFIFAVRKRECEVCGRRTELQIHHLHYLENRKAWEYIPDDVMVLCQKCHKAAHGIV